MYCMLMGGKAPQSMFCLSKLSPLDGKIFTLKERKCSIKKYLSSTHGTRDTYFSCFDAGPKWLLKGK